MSCLKVKLKCNTVVSDGQVNLTDTVVAAASVEECICIIWVDGNDLLEVSDSQVILTESFVRDASVVKSVDVEVVHLNHSRVIIDGVLVHLLLGKTVGSVV